MILVLACSSHGGDLPQMAGTELRQIPELCRDGEVIADLLRETGAERLVLTACAETVIADVQAQALRAGVDPLAIQIVPLSADGPATGDLLAAAVARASAFTGSAPEQVKQRRARRVSRRGLFRGAMVEYIAVPGADRERCALARGCRRCIEACPLDAVTIEEGRVTVDAGLCEPCGLCIASCPTGALANPSSTPAMVEAQIRAILSSDDDRGIVFHCGHRSPGGAGEGDRGGLHPSWHQVAVPCTATLPPAAIVAPLLLGAAGVALLPCTATCSDGNGRHEATAAARAALAAAGLPAAAIAAVGDLHLPAGPDLPCDRSPAETSGESGSPLPAAPSLPEEHARIWLELATLGGNGDFRLEDPTFQSANVTLTDGCTSCGTCAQVCPTGALRYDPESTLITFDATCCTGCSHCLPVCPERERGAIALEISLDTGLLRKGRHDLRSGEVATCKRCGTAIASQAMLDRILSMLGDDVAAPEWIDLCHNCRGDWSEGR